MGVWVYQFYDAFNEGNDVVINFHFVPEPFPCLGYRETIRTPHNFPRS
ncbi:hypothetical protein CCP2SC5_140048 [Azospirillaceae bacterium]